jgi:hypothetical protein
MSSTVGGTRMGTRRRAGGLALVVAAALCVSACGGSGDAAGKDDPAPASGKLTNGDQPELSGVFAAGQFDALPKPGGADPSGDPQLDGTDWTQGFVVAGLEPGEVMQFYGDNLPAPWEVRTPPAPDGACTPSPGTPSDRCTYRGVWVSDKAQLEITATPNTTGTDDDDTDGGTELNLLLSGLN